MVQGKPNPGDHVARWVRETGRRLQEGRRARKSARDRGHTGPNRPIFRRPAPPPGWLKWCLAWCVHAYTAMGLVVAAAIALLIFRGDASAFQGCFALMVLATVIDATDGTFARKVGVKQVLPGFDGRRLDDITDFLTYTFLPLLLVWRAGILPTGWEGWLILPLLASAYGFCQVSIKTEDGYFLGFPSLWNVVAFYVYALHFDGWVALGLMILLGLLTFVPSRYLYPSQPGRLNRWSTILGAVWAAMLIFLVWQMPELQPGGDAIVWAVAWISLLYPIYYFVASWVVTLRFWRADRAEVSV
jgi:phosphatidylcholine synthase